MEKRLLTDALKSESRRLGFNQVGACPAIEPPGLARLFRYLDAGYAGEMRFLADRAEAYRHPASILGGVKSILMLAAGYDSIPARPAGPGQGRISRYAWGAADYHDVLHQRLRGLRNFLLSHVPAARVRGVVDTAPLLEHEFAQLAGLGWIGKNTLLLNRQAGSWFFLAALLTDIELAYDEPFPSDHCGSCTACLDACPTGAFPAPYVLDARRCISYLTIELRTAAPVELRESMGEWLFGCDICQEVCPWNRKAGEGREPVFMPARDNNPVDLIGLFQLSETQFRDRFRRTPLWRAKRRGILRNAALVLGNRPVDAAVGALVRGLHDTEPLVRGAAAWALGRYEQAAARAALAARSRVETDDEVRREISAALDEG